MSKKIELTETLKEFFRSSYNEAVAETIANGKLDYHLADYRQPDILSIIEHFEQVLNRRKSELTGDDLLVFNCFYPSLRNMIKNRKLTMGATSFVAQITEFIMYIFIWLNSEKGYNFDAKLESRRKAVEGELTKILVKSLLHVNSDDFILASQPPIIRDRYGLRIILAENDIQLLQEVTKIIVNILTNPSSEEHINFFEWGKNVTSKFGGIEVPKEKLLQMAEYSFSLTHIQDYVNFPKPSTYQSWHGTLVIDSTSPILGGFMFELQIRTWEMHKNAVSGPASHSKYKEELHEYKDIFRIQDYSGGIVFYDGPDNPQMDKDGLSNGACILARHVSPHVIVRTSL